MCAYAPNFLGGQSTLGLFGNTRRADGKTHTLSSNFGIHRRKNNVTFPRIIKRGNELGIKTDYERAICDQCVCNGRREAELGCLTI